MIFDLSKPTKKNLSKFLKSNNVKGNILYFQKLPFKKLILKIENKKKIYFVKITYDEYSLKLSENEKKGYNSIKNIKLFNVPKFKYIVKNKNYSISILDFIDGKKGNFFEFQNFYNFKKKNLKKKKIKDNLNNILIYYSKLNHKILNDIEIKKIKLHIQNKYGDEKILVSKSHGDFMTYNTLKNYNSKIVFDFEMFSNERSYLYDYLHWHLIPFIRRISYFKFLLSFNSLIKLVENIFLKKFENNFKIKIYNKNLYLILFYFEKYLNYKTEFSLSYSRRLIDDKNYYKTKNYLRALKSILDNKLKI